MFFVGIVIDWVLWIFLLILFARMILSWVPVLVRDWEPHGPMLVVAEAVYSVTDPPIKALRKVIPPLRIGNFALDLSMLLVFIGAYVLLRINRAIFF